MIESGLVVECRCCGRVVCAFRCSLHAACAKNANARIAVASVLCEFPFRILLVEKLFVTYVKFYVFFVYIVRWHAHAFWILWYWFFSLISLITGSIHCAKVTILNSNSVEISWIQFRKENKKGFTFNLRSRHTIFFSFDNVLIIRERSHYLEITTRTFKTSSFHCAS